MPSDDKGIWPSERGKAAERPGPFEGNGLIVINLMKQKGYKFVQPLDVALFGLEIRGFVANLGENAMILG